MALRGVITCNVSLHKLMIPCQLGSIMDVVGHQQCLLLLIQRSYQPPHTMAATMESSQAISVLESLQLESFSNDAERYAAKEAARKLLARLETPFERSWALSFENPVLVAGLQVCQDLGIWSKWYELDKENPRAAIALDDIAAMATKDVEINLLRKYSCLKQRVAHLLTKTRKILETHGRFVPT